MATVEYKAGSKTSTYKGRKSYYPIVKICIAGEWHESHLNEPQTTRSKALGIARKYCKANAPAPTHIPGSMRRKVRNQVNYYAAVRTESHGNPLRTTVDETPYSSRSKARTAAINYIKSLKN